MSINILLADDSITIQKVIGIIFSGEDYSLTVVDNGKAAVDKALETVPDILLIDALMPGMSGYEVCERIRSIPALAAKPILLLTGSFEPFDESKARSCGADDFIAKPFESQQIIAKVTELCERAAARTFETAAEPATIAPEPAAQYIAPEPTAPIFEPEPVSPFVAPEPVAPIFEPEPASLFVEPEPASPFVEPASVAPTFELEPTAQFSEPEPPPLPVSEPAAGTNDIWAAFTPEEPAPEPVFQPLNAADEPASAPAATETVGSPWVPVDEQAFSFEEETTATELPSSFAEPGALESPAFGEITFAAEFEPEAAQPEVEVIPVTEQPPAIDFQAVDDSSVTFADTAPQVDQPQETVQEDLVSLEESAAPVAVVSAPPALTEDQLRQAISAVSKDVIERIVWEVVPDLAEMLIKEAIRRIKEGQ